MKKLLVGLTGGIGSGKSAAALRFAEHGIVCVDADVASRAVVEPGQPALQQIAGHFGAHVLQADGTLDRAALRQIVFANDAERKWLQALLHPLISAYLRQHIQAATSAYVILVNPLLLESGQQVWCDRILVIDVPEKLQLSRTMARDNNSQAQVENIMRAQMARDERLKAADDVIVNDGTVEKLHSAVDQKHNFYLELCQTHPA